MYVCMQLPPKHRLFCGARVCVDTVRWARNNGGSPILVASPSWINPQHPELGLEWSWPAYFSKLSVVSWPIIPLFDPLGCHIWGFASHAPVVGKPAPSQPLDRCRWAGLSSESDDLLMLICLTPLESAGCIRLCSNLWILSGVEDGFQRFTACTCLDRQLLGGSLTDQLLRMAQLSVH